MFIHDKQVRLGANSTCARIQNRLCGVIRFCKLRRRSMTQIARMTELAVYWSNRLLPPPLTTVTRIKTCPIPLVYAASRRTDVRCRLREHNAGLCAKTVRRGEAVVHFLFISPFGISMTSAATKVAQEAKVDGQRYRSSLPRYLRFRASIPVVKQPHPKRNKVSYLIMKGNQWLVYLVHSQLESKGLPRRSRSGNREGSLPFFLYLDHRPPSIDC